VYYTDRKNNLWIGTDGGGVSKYDGKGFTNLLPVRVLLITSYTVSRRIVLEPLVWYKWRRRK
jgi:hypothetical protein